MPIHRNTDPVERIEVTITYSDGTVVGISADKPQMPEWSLTRPERPPFPPPAFTAPPSPEPAEAAVSFTGHPDHGITVSCNRPGDTETPA